MLVRYFETLKETLKLYVNNLDSNVDPMNIINSNYFMELYVIQFIFIQDSYRSFVESLQSATNGEF